MQALKQLLARAWYRSHFYLNVPMVLQLLAFRELRDEFYAGLWRDAAASIGARATPWKAGFTRIERDGLTTMVRQGSLMLDDHLLLDLMGNKALTLALMGEKGYATPRCQSLAIGSVAGAERFLDEIAGPVVVKPASGTGGGRGVTTGITDMQALRAAARLAARYDTDLLVEEQIGGSSYRLLYLDGQFLDAVRRDPPVVTGNGRDTIRRLVSRENDKRLDARPITALSPLRVDRDCLNTLEAQGRHPRSVLKPGERITVKTAVNENCAAANHTVIDQVHPDTVELGARLVRDLGVRLAGLDLICRDIRSPLTADNGCINEINTTPGLHHHYLVADPSRRVPVAEYVLEYMFQKRIGVMRLDRFMPDVQPGAMHVPTYPHAVPAFRPMRPAE